MYIDSCRTATLTSWICVWAIKRNAELAQLPPPPFFFKLSNTSLEKVKQQVKARLVMIFFIIHQLQHISQLLSPHHNLLQEEKTSCKDKLDFPYINPFSISHGKAETPEKGVWENLVVVLCWGRTGPILLTYSGWFFQNLVSFWGEEAILLSVANPQPEPPVTPAYTCCILPRWKALFRQGLELRLVEVAELCSLVIPLTHTELLD